MRGLQIHILIWAALAVAAALTAGPYSLASCWHVPFLYVPNLKAALFAIPVVSLIGLVVSLLVPASMGKMLRASQHGIIFSVGIVACIAATALTVGQVRCL